MSIQRFFLTVLLFISGLAYSQISEPHTFGEPSWDEINFSHYPQDPDAAGVVLYERGYYTVDVVNNRYIRLIKKVHGKIKVLNADNFDHATIEIPYYHQDQIKENVNKIQAITHNGRNQTYVTSNAIFDINESPYWSLVRFTFPNVKDGSILEYTYQIESPFFSNIGTWEFMNDLPTLYSELQTKIPGNFSYNRSLYGDRELDINHAEIKKSCFQLPGFKVAADCESATYAMKNVPAFKKEEFMLSERNYKPSLKFELIETIDFDESRLPFARNWKEIDRRFKYDKDFGRQLKHTSFFKEQLPSSILSTSNKLERAKAVYYFIQDHFNWNGHNRILSDIRVKNAFERKEGNSSEINLSLINALEAADIESHIMLVPTRDRALPSKQYPILTDFNYAIVYLTIDGQKYLLDATEKNTPFGVLPYRVLNIEGRVLDFKKGSYWEPITAYDRNMHYLNVQIAADDEGKFKGQVSEVSTGYMALSKRNNARNIYLPEVIQQKQSENEHLNIRDYVIKHEHDLEKPFEETYAIDLHEQFASDRLFLYPFLIRTFFDKNPFSQTTRHYPIDFGFPIINNYLISIDLTDQYEVVKVPENRMIRLPNNDGDLSVVYDTSDSKINLRLNLRLNNTAFPVEAYQSLQEFFTLLVKIQSEEPIELRKI